MDKTPMLYDIRMAIQKQRIIRGLMTVLEDEAKLNDRKALGEPKNRAALKVLARRRKELIAKIEEM